MGFGNKFAILAFHRVGSPPPRARYRGQYVTPAHLSDQVSFLQDAGYRFCTLAEAAALIKEPPPPSVGAVHRAQGHEPIAVVTFDDGYRNNLELGLPVLERLGVRATVFVVTDDVGKRDLIWSEAGETNPADLLDWQDLKQLRQVGWEIGSHCSQHVHLARRPRDEQRLLLQKSLGDLRSHFGDGSYSLAYPFGSYNQDTIEIVRELGFTVAVTTRYGVNVGITNVYELKRIPLKGYRIDHFVRSRFWLWAAGVR